MKKIYNVMMLAAVAAAALVSCAKEMDKPEVAPQGEGIKVTVVTANEVETKTALSGEKSVVWTATDKVGFFNHIADVNVESSAASIDGDGKATFTATVPAAGTYYAYYPYQADGSYAPDAEGVTIRLKNVQNAAPSNFDPLADLLVSTSFEADGSTDTPAAIQFKRLGSFLKLSFSDGATADLSSQKVKSVTITRYSEVSGSEPEKNLVGRFKISGTEGLVYKNSGYKSVTVKYEDDFTLTSDEAIVGVRPQTLPKDAQLVIEINTTDYHILRTITMPKDVVLGAGDIQPISIAIKDTDLTAKGVKLQVVWSKKSEGSTAWNEYYGGTAGSDRNIAIDDDYVYVAENAGTAKLWAIDRTDASKVKAVNVEGVSGGTHPLSCPRVIKNTDSSVNGGKDVLVCSSLTRGGGNPKLYMWINGIDNAPKAVTLTTYATGAWYGDVFTVFGTLQDGVLFFDKIGGEDANGVVTFILSGVPGDALSLLSRLKFVDAYGSHSGACAYYPFPTNVNAGIYSPGRGQVVRGKSVVVSGDIKAAGGKDVTLTDLNYSSGRNGCVLGYNFIDWNGKRYVIYGKQESNTLGKTYILEGSTSLEWLTIANRDWDGGEVKFRRDLKREDGCTLESNNSGMDIAARIIDGDLYIAVQKQSIGCELYRIYYD